MKTSTTRKSAFTLVEIMIVVAIIGMLAAIAIPNFVKARSVSAKNACIANLKQIEGAKATWALEQKKSTTDLPAPGDLYGTANYIRDEPLCPLNGIYDIREVQFKPECSEGPTSGHTL